MKPTLREGERILLRVRCSRNKHTLAIVTTFDDDFWFAVAPKGDDGLFRSRNTEKAVQVLQGISSAVPLINLVYDTHGLPKCQCKRGSAMLRIADLIPSLETGQRVHIAGFESLSETRSRASQRMTDFDLWRQRMRDRGEWPTHSDTPD